MIAIVDYGMGNLRSVLNACLAVGARAEIAHTPDALASASGIILPGVGAFGDGMERLRQGAWIPALESEVRRGGKPLFGICLGMQLLATSGTEHGVQPGLGWVDGTVEALRSDDPAVRIPHIGWNEVRVLRAEGLYAGLASVETFYFVHSFALVPKDRSCVTAVCSHGPEFVASIEAPPFYGTQFHPEKSQKPGMRLLRNFLTRAGAC